MLDPVVFCKSWLLKTPEWLSANNNRRLIPPSDVSCCFWQPQNDSMDQRNAMTTTNRLKNYWTVRLHFFCRCAKKKTNRHSWSFTSRYKINKSSFSETNFNTYLLPVSTVIGTFHALSAIEIEAALAGGSSCVSSYIIICLLHHTSPYDFNLQSNCHYFVSFGKVQISKTKEMPKTNSHFFVFMLHVRLRSMSQQTRSLTGTAEAIFFPCISLKPLS